MIKTSDIQPGVKVYTTIREEPWTVAEIDSGVVLLQRNSQSKMVKLKSMLSYYSIVGSEADLRFREECKRHKWPVWEET